MPSSDDPRRAGALLLLAALVLMVAFSTSYVGAFHDPKPHDVKVALVAPSDSAAQAAAQLNALPGSPLDVEVAVNLREALQRIDDRELYGAYDATNDRLYVASAANRATATALELTLDRVRAQQGAKAVTVVDRKPLDDSDPNGTTIFYLVVAWVFGGYLAGTLLGLLAGPRSSTRGLAATRLTGVIAFSALGSLLSLLVARWSFGVLDDHLVATWLAGTLTIAASGCATVGLQALAGTAGTGLVILLFVILGNPSSGGPYARPLLPGFWSTIGGVLPPGAGVDVVRAIAFFDGARIAGPLLVLLAWGLGGAALALLFGGRGTSEVEARAAAGAAAAG